MQNSLDKKLCVQNWLCAGSKEYHRAHAGYGNPPAYANKSANFSPQHKTAEAKSWPLTRVPCTASTRIYTYYN